MHNKNLRGFKGLLIIALSVVGLYACKKEYETIEQIDDRNIAAYKSKQSGLTFTDTAGYSYAITTQGTGAFAKNTDSVFYGYTFKSLSGKVFNQTSDLMIPGTYLGYTDQFFINNKLFLIKPVREVLSKLKRGSKAQLLLPSRMAFGKNGLAAFGIGSNESLLVELEMFPFIKKHEVDTYEINSFISRNNLTFDTDANGIKYKVTTPGTGNEPILSRSVLKVNYTGRYLDGSKLDEGKDASLQLDQLVKGWQLILPGRVTAGGKIRIIIPSHLAYGSSSLDFEIEVLTVTNN